MLQVENWLTSLSPIHLFKSAGQILALWMRRNLLHESPQGMGCTISITIHIRVGLRHLDNRAG